MSNVRTNTRAAAVACRLLESDELSFYSVLKDGKELSLNSSRNDAHDYAEVHGQLEIWWGAEIDARDWGIKSIDCHVKKLVLDGWVEVADGATGDMCETGERFRCEYPEPVSKEPIGPDVDAPTSANIDRLSTPKWTVTSKTVATRSRDQFFPEATVDIDKRTINIEF